MDIKRKYIELFLDLNKSENGLLGFTLSNRYNLSVTDVISFSLSKFIKKCHEDLDIPIQDYDLLINDLKEKIQFASVQQDLFLDNQI